MFPIQKYKKDYKYYFNLQHSNYLAIQYSVLILLFNGYCLMQQFLDLLKRGLVQIEIKFRRKFLQNQSGRISRDELSDIMMTLLAMENFSPPKSDELINEIFRDLDLNQDGLISKREFLIATTQSSILSKILGHAAEEERKKKSGKHKTSIY